MADAEYYDAFEYDPLADVSKEVAEATKKVERAATDLDRRVEVINHAVDLRHSEISAISEEQKELTAQLRREISDAKTNLDRILASNSSKAQSTLGDATLDELAAFVRNTIDGEEFKDSKSQATLREIAAMAEKLHKETGSATLKTQQDYAEHFSRIEGYAGSLEFCFSELLQLRSDDGLTDEDREEKEDYWRKMLGREIDVISAS